MAIEGKYEMESSEHFEEFVKEMGKFSHYFIDGLNNVECFYDSKRFGS